MLFLLNPIRQLAPAHPWRRAMLLAATSGAFAIATPALADCVADATGANITCSGSSASYANTTGGVTLTAQAGGTLTGPLTLGSNASVSNAGTITGPAGAPTVQVGASSALTNSGTITQTNATTGSAGIVAGDYASVINSGTLTGVAGGPIVSLGKGGTFLNTGSASAAVVGNITFGANGPTDTARFTNQNLTYGFSGNITSIGNTAIDNAGAFTGNIAQTYAGGAVTIINDSGATFTGSFTTGDATTLTNAGTMTLTAASLTGGYGAGAASAFTNNATLNLGTATIPATLTVNGNFAQTAGATLGVTIASATSYGQVIANGSATLAGNLALIVTPGYYPSGSKFDVVLGNAGVSGTLAVSGNQLPFITFVPVGIVTVSGTQQAFELVAQRTTTYAAAIAPVATPNQLAIATAYQGVVTAADAATTSDAAALVGLSDVLTVPQAQVFFDSLSPAGYLAYANAMRDQANLFQRQVALRMADQNSDHVEDGFWGQAGGAIFGKAARGTPNSRETGFQLTMGYDWSSPRYVIGAAFSYTQAHLTYGQGNLVGHNNAYVLGGYGAYHLGPLIASGQASYQLGNFAANKVITIGTTTRTASAGANDRLLTLNGTLGAELTGAGVVLTPFAGVAMQRGSISPFTESGALAADLSVSRISANRTDFIAGANLTRAGGELRPFVRAAWRSQLGTGTGPTVSAYLNGDPTTLFTVIGQPAARHQADVDAGLNYVVNDEGGLFITYQGTFRNDLTSHGVMAGFRLEF